MAVNDHPGYSSVFFCHSVVFSLMYKCNLRKVNDNFSALIKEGHDLTRPSPYLSSSSSSDVLHMVSEQFDQTFFPSATDLIWEEDICGRLSDLLELKTPFFLLFQPVFCCSEPYCWRHPFLVWRQHLRSWSTCSNRSRFVKIFLSFFEAKSEIPEKSCFGSSICRFEQPSGFGSLTFWWSSILAVICLLFHCFWISFEVSFLLKTSIVVYRPPPSFGVFWYILWVLSLSDQICTFFIFWWWIWGILDLRFLSPLNSRWLPMSWLITQAYRLLGINLTDPTSFSGCDQSDCF